MSFSHKFLASLKSNLASPNSSRESFDPNLESSLKPQKRIVKNHKCELSSPHHTSCIFLLLCLPLNLTLLYVCLPYFIPTVQSLLYCALLNSQDHYFYCFILKTVVFCKLGMVSQKNKTGSGERF